MARRNPPPPPPPEDERPDVDDLLADAPDIGDLMEDAPDIGPDVSDLLAEAPVLPITVKTYVWIQCGDEEPEPRTVLVDADTSWTKDEIIAEATYRGQQLVDQLGPGGSFDPRARTPEGCALVEVTIEGPLYYEMPR